MEETEPNLHADYFQRRASQRDAPDEKPQAFNPADWKLLIPEVRRDTRKSVSSGWLREAERQNWLVVIGLEDTVVTAYPTSGGKLGDEIVRSGMLYELLSSVNQKLMEEEEQVSSSS